MNTENVKFSIISPVYGAETLLPELVEKIKEAVSQITSDYEIILVEDNSPDRSWEIIKQLSANDNKIVGLSMSRNFGQQNALNAGLDYATGDYIVTLDCDLQDEPKRIIELYNEALKGFDIVFASRQNRKDGFLKKLFSKLFYKVLSYLSETQLDNSIANFVLYKRKVVEAMASVGDYYRYYPMLNQWVGFKTTKLLIPHAERKDNKASSYSFKKRLSLAFTTIISFSDKPLHLVLKLGISIVGLFFVLAVAFVLRYFIMDVQVSGWLSIFLSVCLLSGIMIIIMGILGVYMGKIFDTVKSRPVYLIKEMVKKD